ncbi:MAG: PilZ domain-containing protein [Desulfomonile tiedjei]|nr:PilZ domain-containing protein [Desulfomonile tiedjei]
MPKRRIVIREFIGDVRDGKTDYELMQKYDLDPWGLKNALAKMVEIKALLPSDLESRQPHSGSAADSADRREFPRQYVLFSFPVYLAKDLQSEGFVNDISERGLQVTGLEFAVGDTKSLLIRADEFADIYPFVFDATCRWSTRETTTDQFTVGLEIANISDRGREELRNLIDLLAFP